MKKPSVKEQCERAKVVLGEIDSLSEKRKRLYDELDELAVSLKNAKGIESHGIRVKNAFEKGNTQWGHGPVRALVIEVLEPESKASA